MDDAMRSYDQELVLIVLSAPFKTQVPGELRMEMRRKKSCCQ